MISSGFRSKFGGLRMAVVGCCLTALLGACADQQPLPEQQAAVTTSVDEHQDQKGKLVMQRVIVNLAPSDVPVPDQVVELTRKYPQSKTLRVLASFRQVVLELPVEDMKALAAEPEVQQVALDQRNSPSN